MKQLRNEQGYALAIAVLVITVLSILGISLMATTGNSKKMANKEQENQAAYYIAEAGMNLKKAEIKKAADQFRKDTAGWNDTKLENALKQPPKINTSTTYNSKNSNGTDKVFDTNNASAKVTVEYTTKPGEKTTTNNQTKAVQNYIYKIKSVGMIDNQKRTITSTMSYDLTVNSEEQKPEVKPDENKGGSKYVVHAMDEINVNSITINGLLGFKKNKPLSIISPFSTKNNNSSLIGANSGKKYINNEQYNYKTPVNNKDIILGDSNIPKVPEFPNNKINELDSSRIATLKFYKIEKIKNKVTLPSNDIKNYSNNTPLKSGEYKITASDLNKGININTSKVKFYIVEDYSSNFLKEYSSQGKQNIIISGSGSIAIISQSFELNNDSNFKSSAETTFINNSMKVTDASQLQINNSLEIISDSISLSPNPQIDASGNLNISTKEFSATTNPKISSSKNINIFASNLNLQNNPKITAKENLTIYVNDTYTASGNKKLFILNSQNSKLYFSGNNPLYLHSGIDYNLDIYSLNSCINNAANSFKGDIVIYEKPINTDDCKIQSQNIKTKNYLYAPFADFTVVDDVNFTGSLIVNKLIRTSGGKATLTYSPPEIGVMPDPLPPGNNGSNNGDSIIIDSSFSDAIDSGTVEIDND